MLTNLALTIARLMTFAVVGGLVYVTYIVEMAGYDAFRKCNKNSTMTRMEWGPEVLASGGLQEFLSGNIAASPHSALQ
ncbi:MAG: hypothetical protein JO008_10765 [Alphaproteobacteria bacterium]|nr:hypothetical protein [Alphaproteobacteria bacterium]